MEGMMESSAVTLVVKTPNRSIEDLQISCALNWTVEKLKRHLSSVYPSKPESKKQRLIYSGQLLLDHQIVKEFLREHQDGKLHTVHLVCPPPSSESLSSPSTSSSTGLSSASPTSTSVASTPSSPTQTMSQPVTDGLRYRRQNTPPMPMFMPSAPPMWPMNGQAPFQAPMFAPPLSPQMNHQLWMQHMQQMYQQHQMAAARQPQANFMYMPPNMQMPFWPYQRPPGTHPVTPPVNITPMVAQQPTPPQTPQAPPQPPPQADARNIPQRQPAQPRNQEVRMNAQGGIADDDDDEENLNNDWLDKIYTLCRVAILLSIVWFYSSTGRFLMLILSVVLIYMYQWGAFQWLFQNRNAQPQVPVNNPEPQQQEPNQDEQEDETDNNTEHDGDSNSEEEVTETPDTETPETETVPAQPPAPPPGPSAFRVAISFISTFFTSLIPQQNDVFQGN